MDLWQGIPLRLSLFAVRFSLETCIAVAMMVKTEILLFHIRRVIISIPFKDVDSDIDLISKKKLRSSSEQHKLVHTFEVK